LGGQTLDALSNHCPSLQVLELKECILEGRNNISAHSLESLTMDNSRIWADLSVAAPNLLSLRCVKPFNRAPSFGAMGALSTATVILVDSFLATTDYYSCEGHHDYALGLSYSGENASYLYDNVYGSDAESISTCPYGELADVDSDDDEHSSADPSENGNYSSTLGGRHDHAVFGGDGLLLSLSNATSLDLIADIGEVCIYNLCIFQY
jgi:hypothetical protein